jgi:hypothetical protein
VRCLNLESGYECVASVLSEKVVYVVHIINK